MKQEEPFIILGQGYVGSTLSRKGVNPIGTHRSKPSSGTHLFNLNDPMTWKNIYSFMAEVQNLVWTFPAATQGEDLNLVKEFTEKIPSHIRIFVLGSTSRYQTRSDCVEWVNEETPLVYTPRVQAEEWLISTCRATLLALAGIWGPGRSPTDWLEKGLIKRANGWVNLIHVDDIVEAICRLMKFPTSRLGGQIILTGEPKKWSTIVQELIIHGVIDREFHFADESPAETGKKVDNKKALLTLPRWEPRSFAPPHFI